MTQRYGALFQHTHRSVCRAIFQVFVSCLALDELRSAELTLDVPADVNVASGSSLDPSVTGRASAFSTCSSRVLPPARSVWINEIHYDNIGADQSEFIEVAGVSGTDLSCWRLVLYNGESGKSYETIHLSGTIPNEQGGYGAVAFDAPGLQNGAVTIFTQGDGIALVRDPWDEVAEFVSYEGSFVAAEGPAAGLISMDIGVAETDTAAVGESLQLAGVPGAFQWAGPVTASRGGLNSGQNCNDSEEAIVVSFLDRRQASLCGTAVSRLWTAYDTCGHVISALQRITISASSLSGWSFVPADSSVECGESTAPARTGGFASPLNRPGGAGEVWINEIHYDGEGTADTEFIEVAGRAGLDLSGYSLVYYDSSGRKYGGQQYLSGALPSENGEGFGAAVFYPKAVTGIGLQNGPADGVALVHLPSRQVIQFLSYEGSLVALEGPAAGLSSTDIGVEESEGARDISLQLSGSARHWSEFAWTRASGRSPGRFNSGQTLLTDSEDGVVTFHDEHIPGDASLKEVEIIERTWTVSSGCDRAPASALQRITIYDETPPVLTELPTAQLPAEIRDGVAHVPDLTGSVQAQDDCGGPIPIEQEPPPGVPMGFGETIGVVVCARDRCGNVSDPLVVGVTAPRELSASVSKSDPSCAGSSDGRLTVTLQGGVGPIQGSFDNGPFREYVSPAEFEHLCAGEHVFTLRDADGCSLSLRAVLEEAPPFLVTISPDGPVELCAGGSVKLTASPGTQYVWSTGQTESSIVASASGEFSVTIIDSRGCIGHASQGVDVADPLQVEPRVVAEISGNGRSDGSAYAHVRGGTLPYSFEWDSVPRQTKAEATNLVAGTYHVAVTDARGCAVSASVTITEPEVLELSLNEQQNVPCAGGSGGVLTVGPSGGRPPYLIRWETSPEQLGATATNLVAGVYVVSVTDAPGNTASATFQVTEPSPLTLGLSGVNASCAGRNDASIDVQSDGGTPPYWISLDHGLAQSGTIPVSFSNLISGTHTITLGDAAGCQISEEIQLGAPNVVTIWRQPVDISVCLGAPVSLSVGADGPDVRYQWRKNGFPIEGATESVYSLPGVSGLEEGVYDVVVSTSCQTIESRSATLRVLELPHVEIVNRTTCPGMPVILSVVDDTGPGATYYWETTGETTPDITVAPETNSTYRVWVKSPNGCMAQAAANVTIDDSGPVLTISDARVLEGDADSACLVFDVRLSAPACSMVSADFATADPDATNPRLLGASPGRAATPRLDYDAVQGKLVFPPGETATSLKVVVHGDHLYEGDERVVIVLSEVSGAILGTELAIGTIIDDDPLPLLRVTDPCATERDGLSEAVFELSLSAPSELPVSVDCATVDGTARAEVDYVPLRGSLVFHPENSMSPLADDPFLRAATGSGGSELRWRGVVGQWTAQQCADLATSHWHEVLEPVEQCGEECVSRLQARGGNRFYRLLKVGSVRGGETRKAVAVRLVDDGAPEAAESFFLALTNVAGAILEKSQATATIFDNDVDLAEVAIVVPASHAGIDTVAEILRATGLSSRIFARNAITTDALRTYRLVIWLDISDQVDPLQTSELIVIEDLFHLGIPLYFAGNHLGACAAGLSAKAQSRWRDLVHLAPSDTASLGPTVAFQPGMNHPLVNGQFGQVLDFDCPVGIEGLSAIHAREVVLARSGTCDVVVAYENATPKLRVATQAFSPVPERPDASSQDRKRLFQNTVWWLCQ